MLIDLEYLSNKYNFTPKGVIHIGAHTGEEQSVYDRLGVKKTLWVEAIPELANRLNTKYSDRGDVKVLNACVSDEEKIVKFQLTNNFASSSILPLKTHLTAHPKIHVVDTVEMKTERMDGYEYNVADYDFINVDVQGAELKVLKGFGYKLDHIKYIYSEVNEKELYEGCCLINELDSFLEKKEFERVETKMTVHGWGDALYARK